MRKNLYLLGVALSVCLLLNSATWADEAKVPPVPGSPETVTATFTGKIREKTEKKILVNRDDGQGEVKVTLSEALLVTKGDLPATLEDLVPGVHVEVKLRKQTAEAISIKILTEAPKQPVSQPLAR